MDYNSTLNLPKTEFSMRANLPKTEPEVLKKWEEQEVYKKILEINKDKPLFVLHDGPPYANGDIHLGTALNKILKDFIIRYKNMSGFKAPYVPGWDTHGLPTEIKARAKAGIGKSAQISDIDLRRICKEFVLKYLNDQREQFKRLGGIGDWKNPYITLDKNFESKQIEIFAEMACKNYIYKGLKPVYWCPECRTALAEAEIEYSEDSCNSVYVKFKLKEDLNKFKDLNIDLNKVYFIIWTTTVWTLPGNMAICVNSEFDYNLINFQEEYYIIAEDLTEKVMKESGKENYKVIKKFKGKELEFLKAKHPFLKRDSLIITGEHVTLESGTGLVHTAPGHGTEDFEVCKNYNLKVIVPVDSKGKLTGEAGNFSGLDIKEANKNIFKYLKENNCLFYSKEIFHQYPHCWRCKKPVIFRATEQWFCSVEDFKNEVLKEIKKVKWLPEWGQERISSMVKDRKDWCISRQRKWGVPIPIFYCKNCHESLIDKQVMLKISKLFKEFGSDVWYIKPAEEILENDFSCKKCSCKEFIKEEDIMDVWFDSGSSYSAVCGEREELNLPADLYLEGADQYRGWFQSSLLTSVAVYNKAPYKQVISHGWVVDGEGRKMSKSLGNGIEPEKIIKEYGADILRLWVASSDYHADIRISKEILKQVSESYRKIRNTARYILGNLYDFKPDEDLLNIKDLEEIDVWAISKLEELLYYVNKYYEEYEFCQVFHRIYKFCLVDMSNFYLDIIKDRLYVEKFNSKTRRAAQSTMYIILDNLVRLIAPILAYTSDEIWKNMPHKSSDNKENILFNNIVYKTPAKEDKLLRWDKIQKIRDEVKKALELARKDKIIGSSLEACVILNCNNNIYNFMKSCEKELKDVFIVSEIKILNDNLNNNDFIIKIERASGKKCVRCWMYSESVGENSEHPEICSRCVSVLLKN